MRLHSERAATSHPARRDLSVDGQAQRDTHLKFLTPKQRKQQIWLILAQKTIKINDFEQNPTAKIANMPQNS